MAPLPEIGELSGAEGMQIAARNVVEEAGGGAGHAEREKTIEEKRGRERERWLAERTSEMCVSYR